MLQSLQTNGRMLTAIVRLQPPQMILFRFLGCSRGVRADAGTSATVSVMLRGEGNVTGRGELWVCYISWPHELGSCSPEQDRREAWCLAGTGGGSCSRRGTFEW